MRSLADLRPLRPEAPARPHYRVLLVLEATLAGVARHVLDLADGLMQLGHEVHLAYSARRMEPHVAGELAALEARGLRTVQVLMALQPGLADLVAVSRVRQYLRAYGPFDVVHGHSAKGGAIARLAAAGLGARRVYTPHAFKTMDPTLSRGRRALYGTIERVLARFATDRVLAISSGEMAHARSLGLPMTKLTMIPNGVRIPDDVPDRERARLRFHLEPDVPVIAWIGRLAPQKAPERFVALVARLAAELPRLQVLMLGHGELETPIRQLIRGLGLGSVIQLRTGCRGWDALAAADLFVLTSRYESMAYVVLEAQALGVPVVATEVSGLPDIVADGLVRIVPNTDDPLALTEQVRGALEAVRMSGRPTAPRETSSVRSATIMVREILASYAPDARIPVASINARQYGRDVDLAVLDPP